MDQSQLVQMQFDQIRDMKELNKKLAESNNEKDIKIASLTEEIGKLSAQVETLTAMYRRTDTQEKIVKTVRNHRLSRGWISQQQEAYVGKVKRSRVDNPDTKAQG